MKKINSNLIHLTQLLNDLEFHSGSELGHHLGLTRTAVWKLIHRLQQFGITVISDKSRGYRLKQALYFLDEQSIKAQLTADVAKSNFYLFESIASTNLYLKQIEEPNKLSICLSESQTQGRGRFQRHWHSPFAQNIYLSLSWQFNGDLSELATLSLRCSLTIIKALESYGLNNLTIKWPNDIVYLGKKLGGSLIEIQGENHGSFSIIFGLGLNVNMTQADLDNDWCSIKQLFPASHNRNDIIALIINSLAQNIIKEPPQNLLAQWQHYDWLYNKTINVNQHGKLITGCAGGIDEKGRLVLKDKSGTTHHLSSGDTSLSS